MRVTLVKGSLDDLIRFDLPFIAVSTVTGDLGAYCYAVNSVNNNVLTVSPTLFDSSTIQKDDFAAVASGTFYLVWKNFNQVPDTLGKGEKRFEIRALQRMLKQAGFYDDAINGTYTPATVRAVTSFQQTLGITTDESLGEITLAALIRFDTAHKVPILTQDEN
jgi:general secretion pathway protein A